MHRSRPRGRGGRNEHSAWRRGHAAALAVSLAALAAAYGLPAGGVPLLECRFRRWTGVPCPTCGYTRGVQAVLHGDLDRAVRECPTAILVTGALVATVLLSSAALLRGRTWATGGDPLARRRRIRAAIVVGVAVVAANWIWRLVQGRV